jgi:hypothetical protein
MRRESDALVLCLLNLPFLKFKRKRILVVYFAIEELVACRRQRAPDSKHEAAGCFRSEGTSTYPQTRLFGLSGR